MNSLNGKRLLILGGQLKMCDIVKKARELGVYTIVTDWYEDSPAKQLADEAYMISTSDVDAVVDLIKKKHIDGVFTGFIDSTLPYYFEICSKAHLPCYLNKETVECCTNKKKFKSVCRKVGINTIPDVDITRLEAIDYPFLIKPVDNSGSKGITVCSNPAMVPQAYEKALRFSKSKNVLTEKFMNCDYVCAHYVVSEGKTKLLMIMDKDMNRIGRGTVPYPTAMVSPSKYEENFLQTIDPKIQKLAEQLKLYNGTFLISFFVSGSNYYAVELAARLTATREYIFIKDIYGIDTLEMHIRYALGDGFSFSFPEREKENTAVYCMLFSFLKDGIIGKIGSLDKVKGMPEVLDVLQLRGVGAKIRSDGSYGQLLSRIYLKSETEEEMVRLVGNVQNMLNVIDTDGKSMIITGFAADKFFF